MKKHQINSSKHLTEAEMETLLGVLEKYPDRDSILLELALRTGARAQELLNIRVSDIDPKQKSVLIRGMKGSNDRTMPVTRMFKKLSALVEKQNLKPEDRLFDISYSRLVQVWDMHRPSKKSFKSLRHTFAIELYKKRKNIHLVQMALGHVNIQSTMVYMTYVHSLEEMRAIEHIRAF